MISNSRLLTVREAEERTGRKASTWRRDIAQRLIPSVKIGRSVRIPEEAVNALIAQGWRDALNASPRSKDSKGPGLDK